MKYFLSAAMAAGWFCLAMAAFAQSTSSPQATPSAPQATSSAPQATPSPAPSASPAAANTSAGGGGGKRAECRTATQGKTGQDRQDQMQLCLAQARVDCLKQAIDQKVANDKRKDFLKSCMQED